MTGSGTENDPYIVETWEEFVSAFNASSKYITFPDDTILDFNEIQNYSRKLTGRYNTVLGNGVNFRNIMLETGAFISATNKNTFDNMRFTNLYFTGDASFISSSNNNDWCYFTNCQFAGVFQGNSKFNNSGDNLYFGKSLTSVGCGINLKLSEQAVFRATAYSCYCYNCQLTLDCESSASDTSINIYNSLIEGNIGGANRSIWAVNCVLNANIETTFTNTNTGKVSVANADKIGENGAVNGFAAVTSEQLKNAEYLSSIGFPIGG